jgi:hypothetical protein
MKVFIVLQNYDDKPSEVVAVYDNEESANEFARAMKNPSIVPFYLNTHRPFGIQIGSDKECNNVHFKFF